MLKPHHTPHAWFAPSSTIVGAVGFRTIEWVCAYVAGSIDGRDERTKTKERVTA